MSISTFLNSNGLTKGNIQAQRSCPFINECRAFVLSKCPSEKHLKQTPYSCAFARGLSLDMEGEKKEKARKEAEERHAFWLENINSVLQVVKHKYKTCTDDLPFNSKRCIRCALLEIKDNDYWPPEFELEIYLERKRE